MALAALALRRCVAAPLARLLQPSWAAAGAAGALPQWPARLGLGLSGRALASRAGELAAEVEYNLASGQRLPTGGSLYSLLDAELSRLRWDNDRIIARVDDLKKIREAHVVEEDKILEQMRSDPSSTAHGTRLIETLKRIEEIDFQIAGLRSQQLENSRGVSAMKRGKVRIELSDELMSMVEKVDEVLREGKALSQKDPLTGALSALVQRQLEEYDRNAAAALEAKKDIENSLAKMRTLALGKRVRRGRIDPETEAIGGQLVASFYELQRKNAKLVRLRDVQLLNTKEVNVLERVIDKLARHARIQELIDSGDKAKMQSEADLMLHEMEVTKKALAELEAVKAGHAREAAQAVERLRAPDLKDAVTPETGALREGLFAALRGEELCASRLAVLRGVKAQHAALLGELRTAMLRQQ